MIRRILVVLGDDEHVEPAARIAIDLARTHQGELTGMAVLDTNRIGATGSVPLGAGHIAAELREHRLAKVRWIISGLNRRFKSVCKDSGVRFRVEQPEGDPYQCVADAARYHDVMVCGLGQLFEHGVVAEPPAELVNLVSRGVRPLVTVATQYRPIERVLVAYSGSVESANAMKRFVQLRLWPEATLRIVTFEHPQQIAEQLLADALGYFRAHDLQAETDYVPKSPHRNLLPYAQEWDANLIVMGNSHRNVLLRRIFGETMYDVLQTTDRPLFLAQ